MSADQPKQNQTTDELLGDVKAQFSPKADEAQITPPHNSSTLPPFRYVMSERRISRCQAWEDGCEYEHCPRWREGKIINNAHCALDLIGIDNE